jgi:hypothetical protein
MFILFEKGTEYSCQNCDARCIVFILASDIDLRLCGLCYEELRRALKVSETEPRSPTNDAAKPLPEGWKPRSCDEPGRAQGKTSSDATLPHVLKMF